MVHTKYSHWLKEFFDVVPRANFVVEGVKFIKRKIFRLDDVILEYKIRSFNLTQSYTQTYLVRIGTYLSTRKL